MVEGGGSKVRQQGGHMAGSRRSSKILIAAGTVVVVLAAMAAIAAAALSTRSKSVDIRDGHDGSTTAACPSGSEAVSGGFASPGFDPKAVGAGNLVFTSHRVNSDQWRAQAHNFGGQKG